MLMRSTALGKTLLHGGIGKIEITHLVPETLKDSKEGKEPSRLLMVMEVNDPVTWTIRTFIEPKDIRHMIALVLKSPKTLFYCFCFLFSKGPKPKQPENDK